MYRLKAHINARICLHFDRSKDSIVPIAARPSLRMHLRYKSIPGLLLDKPLISELAHHCAYCHQAIPARSIRKHYSEQHQGLLAFEAVHRDIVYGLANLGSGRGTSFLVSRRAMTFVSTNVACYCRSARCWAKHTMHRTFRSCPP